MTPPGRERVFVALGSNLGDRSQHLEGARRALGALPDTALISASTIEETAPLAGMPQPPYLNQMVEIDTTLAPRHLLEACQEIERQAGRVRGERWGPRTLDVDIVLYGDRRVHEADLTIPHPELTHRDFWQRELEELRANEP